MNKYLYLCIIYALYVKYCETKHVTSYKILGSHLTKQEKMIGQQGYSNIKNIYSMKCLYSIFWFNKLNL